MKKRSILLLITSLLLTLCLGLAFSACGKKGGDDDDDYLYAYFKVGDNVITGLTLPGHEGDEITLPGPGNMHLESALQADVDHPAYDFHGWKLNGAAYSGTTYKFGKTDVTFVADVTEKQPILTFYASEESGAASTELQAEWKAPYEDAEEAWCVTIPANTFENGDLVFDGWYYYAPNPSAADGKIKVELSSFGVSIGDTVAVNDITFASGYEYKFYAKWDRVAAYTLTFRDWNDGIMFAYKLYDANDNFPTFETLYAAGLPGKVIHPETEKTLRYWMDEDGTKYDDLVGTAVKNATYTNFSGSYYTYVDFDINGGEGTVPEGVWATGKVGPTAKATVTMPSGDGLTKTGFVFGGWTDNEDIWQAGASVTFEKSTTLYAVWKDPNAKEQYSVSFFSGIWNITEGTPDSYKAEEGSTINLPTEYYWNRPLYKQVGWKIQHMGAEDWENIADATNLPMGGTYTMPSEKIRIVAIWEEATSAKVHFDANGATGGPVADQTLTKSSSWPSITLPDNGFTAPEGKSFAGWAFTATVSTNEDLLAPGASVRNSAYSKYAVYDAATDTHSVTFYAIWTVFDAVEMSDVVGVWTNGGNEIIITEQGAGTVYNNVGYAIYKGNYTPLFQTGASSLVFYDNAGYNGFYITVDNGTLTVTSIESETAVSFTSKTALSSHSFSEYTGKYVSTKNSVKWYLTADDGDKFYFGMTLTAHPFDSATCLIDKYIVLEYDYGCYYVLTKGENNTLTGWLLESEKSPASVTFNVGTFHTLSIEGTLKAFVDHGASVNLSGFANKVSHASGEAVSWQLVGGGAFDPSSVTADVDIEPKIIPGVATEVVDGVTFTGSYTVNGRVFTKFVVNVTNYEIAYYYTKDGQEYSGNITGQPFDFYDTNHPYKQAGKVYYIGMYSGSASIRDVLPGLKTDFDVAMLIKGDLSEMMLYDYYNTTPMDSTGTTHVYEGPTPDEPDPETTTVTFVGSYTASNGNVFTKFVVDRETFEITATYTDGSGEHTKTVSGVKSSSGLADSKGNPYGNANSYYVATGNWSDHLKDVLPVPGGGNAALLIKDDFSEMMLYDYLKDLPLDSEGTTHVFKPEGAEEPTVTFVGSYTASNGYVFTKFVVDRETFEITVTYNDGSGEKTKTVPGVKSSSGLADSKGNPYGNANSYYVATGNWSDHLKEILPVPSKSNAALLIKDDFSEMMLYDYINDLPLDSEGTTHVFKPEGAGSTEPDTPPSNVFTFTGNWKGMTKVVINTEEKTMVFTINGKETKTYTYQIKGRDFVLRVEEIGEELYFYMDGNTLGIYDWPSDGGGAEHYADFTKE